MRQIAFGLGLSVVWAALALLGALPGCSSDRPERSAAVHGGGGSAGSGEAGAGGGSAGSSQAGNGGSSGSGHAGSGGGAAGGGHAGSAGGGQAGSAGGGEAGSAGGGQAGSAGGGEAGSAGSGEAGSGGGTAGSGGGGSTGDLIIADHRAVADFDRIPDSYIQAAKEQFRIYYTHTSHGSQIDTGMQMLASGLGGVFNYPSSLMTDNYGDLGHAGDTTFIGVTQTALNNSSNTYNVIMWSWCSGMLDNTTAGIQTYVNGMSQLEAQYPAVKFIYMTGHADQWSTANNRARNQEVRDYCVSHNKILFDFEDIESWDPDGNFHQDAGDDCAWCTTWCSSHTCPSCSDCAHSHCFNCYQKGKAFWWMMARMAGWDGN